MWLSGEPPEEGLGAFQGTGVVERIERRSRVVDQVGEPVEHRPIEHFGDPCRVDVEVAIAEPEDELGGVEQLDRKTPTDLHLAVVECGVGARTPTCGPVADRIGAVLFEELSGHHDVAFGLRHLLAVGVDYPTRDRRVAPRRAVGLVVRSHDGGEQPGADDVVGLGPDRSMGKVAAYSCSSVRQPVAI